VISEGVLPPERFIYRIYTCIENANEQLILNAVECGFDELSTLLVLKVLFSCNTVEPYSFVTSSRPVDGQN